jgi:hypothetical protein
MWMFPEDGCVMEIHALLENGKHAYSLHINVNFFVDTLKTDALV